MCGKAKVKQASINITRIQSQIEPKHDLFALMADTQPVKP